MTLLLGYNSTPEYDYEMQDGYVTVYIHFSSIDNVHEVLDDADYEAVGFEIVDSIVSDYLDILDEDLNYSITVDLADNIPEHFAIRFSQSLTQAVEAMIEDDTLHAHIVEGFQMIYGSAEDDE